MSEDRNDQEHNTVTEFTPRRLPFGVGEDRNSQTTSTTPTPQELALAPGARKDRNDTRSFQTCVG